MKKFDDLVSERLGYEWRPDDEPIRMSELSAIVHATRAWFLQVEQTLRHLTPHVPKK